MSVGRFFYESNGRLTDTFDSFDESDYLLLESLFTSERENETEPTISTESLSMIHSEALTVLGYSE